MLIDLRFPASESRVRSPFTGFTLLELIVVLVIIALAIAVVVPRVGSNWKQIEDSDFLQEFTETIKRSRLFAMNCGHPVAFRLNGARGFTVLKIHPGAHTSERRDIFRKSSKGPGNRRLSYRFSP